MYFTVTTCFLRNILTLLEDQEIEKLEKRRAMVITMFTQSHAICTIVNDAKFIRLWGILSSQCEFPQSLIVP